LAWAARPLAIEAVADRAETFRMATAEQKHANAEPNGSVDLRASLPFQARVVDSLIPLVQRSAGRAALLRDARLEIAVSAAGEPALRFVGSTH